MIPRYWVIAAANRMQPVGVFIIFAINCTNYSNCTAKVAIAGQITINYTYWMKVRRFAACP